MNPIDTNTKRQLIVNNDLDVVKARLRAREVARELGFGTIDQARISLAAGELARVLARNREGAGQITILGIKTEGHMGIQVISLEPTVGPLKSRSENGTNHHPEISDDYDALADVFALVDDYLIDEQDQAGKRVTLMKWLS